MGNTAMDLSANAMGTNPGAIDNMNTNTNVNINTNANVNTNLNNNTMNTMNAMNTNTNANVNTNLNNNTMNAMNANVNTNLNNNTMNAIASQGRLNDDEIKAFLNNTFDHAITMLSFGGFIDSSKLIQTNRCADIDIESNPDLYSKETSITDSTLIDALKQIPYETYNQIVKEKKAMLKDDEERLVWKKFANDYSKEQEIEIDSKCKKSVSRGNLINAIKSRPEDWDVREYEAKQTHPDMWDTLSLIAKDRYDEMSFFSESELLAIKEDAMKAVDRYKFLNRNKWKV